MKILITGATGLIGQELGLQLFQKGHEIFVVSRDRNKALLHLPFPCEVIEGDLGVNAINHPNLNLIEAVIHLMGEGVAEKRWSVEQKTKIYDSRILGTRNLIKSFKKAPKVFISASAIGIYGDRNEEELTEESKPGVGFLEDLCVTWEKEVDDMSSLGATRIVKLRLPPVFARNGGALPKMLPAFQAGVGGRLGTGKQWMSWVHLQDVVAAFIKSVEDDKFAGVFNLSAPEPIRNSDFTKTLCQVLKRHAGPPVPTFALKVLFGEMSQVILASQKVLSQKLQNTGFKYQYPNLESALMDLLKFQHQGEEVFEAKQYLSLSIEKVFEYFSDAKNLEKITPPSLKFHIVRVSTPQLQQGTIIDYKLKIQGVPVKWKTLIETWNPPYSFVDQALEGPYKFWYHTHTFEKLGSGTLMKDEVRFILPMGRLGWLAAYKKVTGDVQKIFDFRRKTVAETMGLR